MKAVVYHADAKIADRYGYPANAYQILFRDFVKNAHAFGMDVVHVTVDGHPGWGDENFFIDADPEHVVYNREVGFIEFLRQADPEEVYWLTEPDSRIYRNWPALEGDLCVLRRSDPVAINPSWRMARTTALPWFQEILTLFDLERRDWHGDSVAFAEMWKRMGRPEVGRHIYNGLDIELRPFKQYCQTRSKFSRQFQHNNKLELLDLIQQRSQES